MNEFNSVAADVKLGANVKLSKFVNLYGCEIGDETKIGAFVEIQKNARVGKRCKVSSHSFICEGVDIEDNVFIGHGVIFTNDTYPRSTNADGTLQTGTDWEVEADGGAKRRVDRLRRHAFVQFERRRKFDCGRWERRYERRPAQYGCGWKPGPGSAVN